MTILALCQNCLAVHRYESTKVVDDADDLNRTGNRLCHCGGDVCYCADCAGDAAALLAHQEVVDRFGVESGSVCNTRTLCNGLQAE